MQRDYAVFPKDDNGEVLWHMRSNGDALDTPRELDFSVIFPSDVTAIEFAVTCLRSGFKVALEEAEEHHEDGLNWNVVVYSTAVPVHSEITAFENAIAEQAAPLGGRTSGWSSIFVPSA